MPQCNFCSKTEDRVPGGIVIKGILGSHICISCVHALLALTLSQQIQRIKILKKGQEEANAKFERLKELAGEEVLDALDPRP